VPFVTAKIGLNERSPDRPKYSHPWLLFIARHFAERYAAILLGLFSFGGF